MGASVQPQSRAAGIALPRGGERRLGPGRGISAACRVRWCVGCRLPDRMRHCGATFLVPAAAHSVQRLGLLGTGSPGAMW